MNQTRRAGRSTRCLIHTHQGFTLLKSIAETSETIQNMLRDINIKPCRDLDISGQWFHKFTESEPKSNYRKMLVDLEYVDETTCCLLNYIFDAVSQCLISGLVTRVLLDLNQLYRTLTFLAASRLQSMMNGIEGKAKDDPQLDALVFSLLLSQNVIFATFVNNKSVDCSEAYNDKDFLHCRLVDQRIDETLTVMLQYRINDTGIGNHIMGIGKKLELYGTSPNRGYYCTDHKYDKYTSHEIAKRVIPLVMLANKVSDGLLEEAASLAYEDFKRRRSSYNTFWQEDMQLQAMILSKAAGALSPEELFSSAMIFDMTNYRFGRMDELYVRLVTGKTLYGVWAKVMSVLTRDKDQEDIFGENKDFYCLEGGDKVPGHMDSQDYYNTITDEYRTPVDSNMTSSSLSLMLNMAIALKTPILSQLYKAHWSSRQTVRAWQAEIVTGLYDISPYREATGDIIACGAAVSRVTRIDYDKYVQRVDMGKQGGLLTNRGFAKDVRYTVYPVLALLLLLPVVTLVVGLIYSSYLNNLNTDPSSLASLISIFVAAALAIYKSAYRDDWKWEEMLRGVVYYANLDQAVREGAISGRWPGMLRYLLANPAEAEAYLNKAGACIFSGNNDANVFLGKEVTVKDLEESGWTSYLNASDAKLFTVESPDLPTAVLRNSEIKCSRLSKAALWHTQERDYTGIQAAAYPVRDIDKEAIIGGMNQ